MPAHDHRCSPFLNRLEDAVASCTPKGRCRIGETRWVILVNSGQDTWEVWLDAPLAPDPNGQIIACDLEEVMA